MPSELILESQGGDPSLLEETLSLRSTQVDDLNKITSATGLEFPPQFAKKDARASPRQSTAPSSFGPMQMTTLRLAAEVCQIRS
jgi:hypothetical protein